MAAGERTLRNAYDEYCSKPNAMTTKDCTQLLTHAGLMKKTGAFSSNNVDITFTSCKAKGQKTKTLDFEQFQDLIKKLTKAGGDYEKVCAKLASTTKDDHLKDKTSKTGAVDRLTDTSKYTGAHKERFDESGKGKGASGRTDKVENTGYVGNYKGEGTYK